MPVIGKNKKTKTKKQNTQYYTSPQFPYTVAGQSFLKPHFHDGQWAGCYKAAEAPVKGQKQDCRQAGVSEKRSTPLLGGYTCLGDHPSVRPILLSLQNEFVTAPRSFTNCLVNSV